MRDALRDTARCLTSLVFELAKAAGASAAAILDNLDRRWYSPEAYGLHADCPPGEAALCRTYEVDGDPVTVRADEPLDEAGRAALTTVVHAAKQLLAEPPSDEQLHAWQRRIEALPMSPTKSLAARILAELTAERARNTEKGHR